MVEVTVPRRNSEVHEAMVQFAARRSYRLSKPWWLEGIRIEAPKKATNHAEVRSGFWASLFFGLPQSPRIDVNLKRKRGRARLKIDVSDHPKSIQLAYELHSYLLDDRSYDCQCPPICTKCGSPVRNVTARYCGRCGHQLVAADESLPPVPERGSSPPPRTEATVPPVIESEPAPVRKESNEHRTAPVLVERDSDVAAHNPAPSDSDGIEASAAAEDADLSETEKSLSDFNEEAVTNSKETDDKAMRNVEPDHPPEKNVVAAEAKQEPAAQAEQEIVDEDKAPDVHEEIPPRRALAED